VRTHVHRTNHVAIAVDVGKSDGIVWSGILARVEFSSVPRFQGRGLEASLDECGAGAV
jgi:hypothetical protein